MRTLPIAAALLLCAAAFPLAAQHRHEQPVQLAPGYAPLGFELPPPGSYELPPMGEAADGAVLDSTGQTQRMHDLLGERIVVLSFIYTSCNDVNGCPLASSVLRSVQDEVLSAPDLKDRVRLISFSFDPQKDTPAVLEKYARHFRRPGFDWRFVTSPTESDLQPLLAGYNQWVVRDHDADGNYLGTISHLLRVYLIDRERRIRNVYNTSYLHADAVANDIRTLLAR